MPIAGGMSYDLNAGISADVNAAVAAATGLTLLGYAARESAGSAAAATFRIVHGATADGGDAIIPVEVAANGSTGFVPVGSGVPCPNGLSIDVLAGTIDVTLFYST